eukprot:jgi/Ulvmu1/7336/UM035_0125.1
MFFVGPHHARIKPPLLLCALDTLATWSRWQRERRARVYPCTVAVLCCTVTGHEAGAWQQLTAHQVQVQNLGRSDGNVALHMRSAKYGKVKKGQLVCVPAKLIRRQSSHLVDIAGQGVQVILGCNGWIWVGVTDKSRATQARAAGMYGAPMDAGADADFTPEPEQWATCARFAAAARAVARLSVPIQVEFLQAVVQESVQRGVSCANMMQLEFFSVVLDLQATRREAEAHRMQTD